MIASIFPVSHHHVHFYQLYGVKLEKGPRGPFWKLGDPFFWTFWDLFSSLKFGVNNENRDLGESASKGNSKQQKAIGPLLWHARMTHFSCHSGCLAYFFRGLPAVYNHKRRSKWKFLPVSSGISLQKNCIALPHPLNLPLKSIANVIYHIYIYIIGKFAIWRTEWLSHDRNAASPRRIPPLKKIGF